MPETSPLQSLSLILMIHGLALSPTSLAAADQQNGTVLGVNGSRFTLNGNPTFLLGFSYYAALGASEEFIRQDLDDLQASGFNWLRVWATWNGYDNNVSAFSTDGSARQPYLKKLQWLVSECDRRGMVVDVTLNRGKEMPDLAAHQKAVDIIVTALKPHRNWYLDLGNERDVGDARFVSIEELKQLREQVRTLDRDLLVTSSFGGHDLSREDVRDVVQKVGVDFLCPHRPRNQMSSSETEKQTRMALEFAKQAGRLVPVHYQEPFRRGYTDWQPAAEDFTADLRGAIKGGAAGWCFHNGGQRGVSDEQPRRSFDLRQKRLMDQLDSEELKFVAAVKGVLAESKSSR